MRIIWQLFVNAVFFAGFVGYGLGRAHEHRVRERRRGQEIIEEEMRRGHR